jgi:hypothetical protein
VIFPFVYAPFPSSRGAGACIFDARVGEFLRVWMGFAVPGFSAISFSQLRGSVPTLKRRSPLIFSPLDIAPLTRKKNAGAPAPA